MLEAIARRHCLDPRDVEIWFGDEARIGQKNKITRRSAKRGTRPSAPQDQRTASTYIFPREGKAVGLILPWCNTEAMDLHLAAISADVAPGRHAALLVDQAGWHLSARLAVPDNITIVPLPAKCPKLNPQQNVWQFMRDNWLSNRVFASYDAIVDHCCLAWNKLADQPWRVMSTGCDSPSTRRTGSRGRPAALPVAKPARQRVSRGAARSKPRSSPPTRRCRAGR